MLILMDFEKALTAMEAAATNAGQMLMKLQPQSQQLASRKDFLTDADLVSERRNTPAAQCGRKCDHSTMDRFKSRWHNFYMASLDDFKNLTSIQQQILGLVADDDKLRQTFYLTGGTLLKALGIVPRESNDLDFFTFPNINSLQYTQALSYFGQVLRRIIGEENIVTTDEGFMHKPSGMLVDAVHDNVQNIDTFISYGELKTASLKDIAASKASALCSRDELKDYVDIAFLTSSQTWLLKDLADLAEQKFGLGTITEEKLLAELISKKDMFKVQSELFLRDKEKNGSLLTQQIAHLIESTKI